MEPMQDRVQSAAPVGWRCSAAAPALALAAALLLPQPAAAANAAYGPVPSLPPTAVSAGALDNHEVPHAWAHLLLDHATVTAGQTLHAAVLITLDNGWHVYWRHPGEAALPTQVELSGDGVAAVGALVWPLPTAYLEGSDILTFGYSGEVALSAPVTIAATAAGEVVLRATVSYLACDIQCVPGDAVLERRLPVAATAVSSPAEAARIARHAARAPQPAAAWGATVAASFAPTTLSAAEPFALRVDVLCPVTAACSALQAQSADPMQHLFWHDLGAVTLRAQRIEPHPAAPGWRIEAAGAIGTYGDLPTQLTGVVKLAGPDGPVGLTFAAPFATVAAAATDASSTAAALPTGGRPAAPGSGGAPGRGAPGTGTTPAPIPLAKLLLFALLGGVILNLMPCVFPVLALKVAAFTRLVQAERGHVLAHAAAAKSG